MEGPPRANAAQLAARNIKAKPKRRAGTPGHASPAPSSQFAQQPPQFAPQSQAPAAPSNGGLFGGSVQGSSGFSFTAPAGGPTFPPQSFGTSNNMFGSPSPNVSDQESDRPENPRAAKRQFGVSAEPNIQQSTPAFGVSNGFTPSQPSNLFGSTASQQGGSNIFGGFTGTSQSPSISFPPPSQTQPTSNIFSSSSFPPPAATATSLFGNKPEAEKPASNIFDFNKPATEKPASNIFNFNKPATGSPSQPTPQKPLFSFGSQDSEPKAASGGFVFGQTTSQAPSSGPAVASTEAPTNIFAKSQPAQTNFFPTTSPAPAKTGNLFGTSTPQSQTPNLFANLNKVATPSATSSASLFANKEQSPAKDPNNIFGGLSQQPAPSPVNIFGNLNQSSAPSQISQDLKPQASNSIEPPKSPAPAHKTLFGNPKPAAPLSNLFGNTPTATPAADEPFKTLNQPLGQSDTPKINGIGSSVNNDSNNLNGAPSSSIFKNGVVSGKQSNASQSPTPAITPALTAGPREPARSALWDQPPYANQTPHTPEVLSLMKEIDNKSGGSIEKEAGTPASPKHRPSFLREVKESTFINTPGNPDDYPELFPGMVWASQLPIARMRSMVPRKFTPAQHVEFYTAYRMRQLNNALARYFKKIDVMDNILPAVTFYNTKRAEILARGTPDLKEEYARLERQPQQSENQENEPPSELTRRIEAPTAAQQGIFSSFSPQPAKTTQPLLNGNATSTPANPFQLSNPQPSLTPSPAPSKGKRKGEDLTKDDYEASSSSSPLKRAKMQQANGTNGGSATSNLFKEALNSPAKPSPSRRSPEKSMPKNPVDDKPRTNPFGNLPVPGKSAVGNSAATLSSGNIFGNASPATTTLFQPSPAKPAATSVFAAPAPSEQKQAPIKPPTFGIQPPKFGAGATSNFMEQFSKKAVDTEEERMREAMEDEYDSEDSDAEPREEWIAKWKKKRAAELKEIKEKGGKGFVFGGDKPQASSEPEKSGNKLSEGKSLFGQPVSSQNSGSSVFSSLNGSRTSTPGPFSSRAGSVLDNHTSGQLPSSGGNIFGHLSDADSGGDSGKGDDADEESANEDTESDTENKDPSYKPGEESKSGPGTPASETGAGIASAKKASNPFTFGSSRSVPSAGLNSGTSTPGGSIFDRITKDANGNPVREISSEEKENTQPSSGTKFTGSNLFAGLNDKTWNPDSPIKFGSTTPSNDSKSAPTVNVQAATPTKPSSPFGNLFGNSTAATNGTASSPAPFSNLFGSSSTPKPTTPAGVGFNFGTTSTSSSLFPSAAVSASTSRATTPGATTDGDSGVEGDPDAEQHEQIDLTAGGPGEEDEEVLHEVRSKALKFVTKSEGDKGQWETKGLGPLRVLKHKDTKAVRILLRADPSGTIVLNKALLSGAKYEPSGKTIKLMTAADTGKGLETWILQVKTPELADSLSKILESNKPSSS